MRRVAIFFYGLFMDAEILAARGVQTRLHPAMLQGFRLQIGTRATLVPSEDHVVYGMVGELTHREIDRLYADQSVSAYRPEAVLVTLSGGITVPALCFSLPIPPGKEERNPEYADKLRLLTRALGFPPDYTDAIG